MEKDKGLKVYKKAVLPRDFKANGVACGIKNSGRLDLALFYSDLPTKAACRFTANKMQAAPVVINKKYLEINRDFRALIVNSGNANCFTGTQGLKDAQEMTAFLARLLKIKKEQVLVGSTGVIGKRLPLPRIKKAIPQLTGGLSLQGIDRAKKAIMTTDRFTKEVTAKINIGKNVVTVCGVAKGAGMIAPDMATMLAFIFTDANITQRALDRALGMSVDNSFNCITVDGCMSTNDSVIVLANAAAENNLIDINKNFFPFVNALKTICLELAKMIIRDGEGATKFIRIKVSRAKDFKEAKSIALNIADSNLFKTAMYGENPNFGRIVAAVGASGVDVKEKKLEISVSPLNKKDIFVDVCINRGKSQAVVYTSDLTPEYIKINAEYS